MRASAQRKDYDLEVYNSALLIDRLIMYPFDREREGGGGRPKKLFDIVSVVYRTVIELQMKLQF